MSNAAAHARSYLPAPGTLLTQTDWGSLEHALGPAVEAPEMLAALLEPDQAARTKSLLYLDHVLHHQNTLYAATVPAALYVAAILSATHTESTIDNECRPLPDPLRTHLLDWMDSVAHEVTDEVAALSRKHGFPLRDYPPALGIQEIRPLLFRAAHAHTSDSDLHVREAAVSACMPLLDDPRLHHHRSALVPLIRNVLGTGARWQYRERAMDTLDAWGEDSSGIEGQQNPFEVCDGDQAPSPDSPSLWRTDKAHAHGYSEDPPF